jgi:uncharacterized membrane protein
MVALVVSMVFLLGMVGLAIDLGRMYIAKSEAQSFVDSAALAAAAQLNGTSPRGSAYLCTSSASWVTVSMPVEN